MGDLKDKAVAGWCPCHSIMNAPGVRGWHDLHGCPLLPAPSTSTERPRIFTQVRNAALLVAGTATVASATIGLSQVQVAWTAYIGPPSDVRADHIHNEPGRNSIYLARSVGAVSGGISAGGGSSHRSFDGP